MKSDDDSCVFHADSSRASTLDDKTSNPRSEETFSVFGDGSCGEPLFAQHVCLDFTPNDDTDSDYIQRKVCSFWQFIQDTPEIINLMASSDRHEFTISPSTPNTVTVTETMKSEVELNKVVNSEKTAVSMLEFVAEHGVIGRMFETNVAKSQCTLGSREYKEEDSIPKQKKKEKKKCVGPCMPSCNACLKLEKLSTNFLTPGRTLSRKLHEWDVKHPKSMNPPGHPPSLQHAVLQRQAH